MESSRGELREFLTKVVLLIWVIKEILLHGQIGDWGKQISKRDLIELLLIWSGNVSSPKPRLNISLCYPLTMLP